MMKFYRTIFFYAVSWLMPLVCSIFAIEAIAQISNRDQEISDKVLSLLAQMTLDEKVGQMNQYNHFWDPSSALPTGGEAKIKLDHLRKGMVGAVLNVTGAENVRKLQKIAVEETRLGIPLLFGFDVIHGYKTVTPIPLGEAASWDLEAIEKSARIAAIEASAVGINWTFAPMVDISRDARWGRVMEGAGEDPYLGVKIGVARIKGFQGDDLKANNTIAATAKHFAGYGFTESGREYNTVDVGTSTLYNIIFPPFKAAVQNDVMTVMNAFNVVNTVPSTSNAFLQRDILKEQWGFEGFVISDWSSGAEMIAHGFAEDLEHVAELSINSGSDMDMESYAFVSHLKTLVQSGKVDIKEVDEAVKRILYVKFRLGLFDDPYKYCDTEREKLLLHHADHQAAALDIARKSIVLLKNDNQLLPLDAAQQKIAVIGPLADDKSSPLGSWSLGADAHTAVSVVEGLKKYTNKYTYAKGVELLAQSSQTKAGQNGSVATNSHQPATGPTPSTSKDETSVKSVEVVAEEKKYDPPSFANEVHINETDDSGFSEAIKLAKESAVVIMVLGEHAFQTGEGRSRTQLDLPGLQQQLLEEIYKVNQQIVLVLMNGRPLTITWADEHLPAIVETWQLGTQCGNAIADVLFGKYNPAGKLPMTFPRNVGQVPIYYNCFNTGRPGPKKEVFWSHYIDEVNTPLYPFGYGLSYTEFEYTDLRIDASNQSVIKVSAKVKNTGKVAGEEVVQLYIRDMVASNVRPVKELKGFEKISLKKGESKVVEFVLTDEELGFYTTEGVFVVEKGAFGVMIGTNSQEGLVGEFTRS